MSVWDGLLAGRRRRDEEAWRLWHHLDSLRPTELPPSWGNALMAGRVARIYQRARTGTKVLIDLGLRSASKTPGGRTPARLGASG